MKVSTSKVVASRRSVQGSGASRRLRRSGKVPGIVYGGTTAPVSIEMDHNPIFLSLKAEAFHSSILSLELDGQAEQVLLRDFQMHPYKAQVLHVDFQRIDVNAKLHTKVPLHFVGQENSPAVKLEAAIVSHILNELEVSCLPKDLPSFLEVDLSGLSLSHPVHVSNIKVPAGVSLVLHGQTDPVVATASKAGGAEPVVDTSSQTAAPAAAPAKS
ncbi:MAG: 50S ribosomal protein L25/general stress protein Ctc [Betaproteobacteria bacterium]|nr:50S ribosomal protein L25/general stress protein Ctc [Betaproteobacteria bacterium]